MSTFEIERLLLAEAVCRRPKMYTYGGTLAEILALFAGYDMALAGREAVRPLDDSPSRVLNWLAETCSYSDKKYHLPSLHVEKILQHFGTEAAAVDAILVFLKDLRCAGAGS